jgi:hypothetical protein
VDRRPHRRDDLERVPHRLALAPVSLEAVTSASATADSTCCAESESGTLQRMSNTPRESDDPSPGPAHVFQFATVSSIEEAERLAGFKATRPRRGTFFAVAVGREFGFAVIAVAHKVGPGWRDLETVHTRRFYTEADRQNP